jgi:hypothetical protein
MHVATGEQGYLDDANAKWDEFGFVGRRPIHFSWDDKQIGAEVRFFRQ